LGVITANGAGLRSGALHSDTYLTRTTATYLTRTTATKLH